MKNFFSINLRNSLEMNKFLQKYNFVKVAQGEIEIKE